LAALTLAHDQPAEQFGARRKVLFGTPEFVNQLQPVVIDAKFEASFFLRPVRIHRVPRHVWFPSKVVRSRIGVNPAQWGKPYAPDMEFIYGLPYMYGQAILRVSPTHKDAQS
jgi:hypothetical protein